MATLPETNDCAHRGVCKFIGDGMCLTECGHYTKELLQTATNSAMPQGLKPHAGNTGTSA